MKWIIMSAFSGFNNGRTAFKRALIFALCVIVAACATVALNANREGLVEYLGAQKNIFSTGKAERVMSLKSLEDRDNLFAIGPVEGLDGEITIFNSRPYISKVRGNDYDVDHTLDHGAIFLVWAQNSNWKDIAIPDNVKGYLDLQRFVKEQAVLSGIDVAKPFPFLISGTAAEVKWHINVDKTEGKTITKELFAKSKAMYVIKNEPVDIIGFYSENHPGVFISQYAPAIKPHSGMKNAIHIHVVSRASKAAGHIDDITLGQGMTLRLPRL
jgi:acetolactate decarboxylase